MQYDCGDLSLLRKCCVVRPILLVGIFSRVQNRHLLGLLVVCCVAWMKGVIFVASLGFRRELCGKKLC